MPEYDDTLEPQHDEAADKRFRTKAAKLRSKKADKRKVLRDEPVTLGEAPGTDAPKGWRKRADGEWEIVEDALDDPALQEADE